MARRNHHLAEAVYFFQLLAVHFQKTVAVRDQFNFSFFDIGRMHVIVFTHIVKNLCRLIFMQHCIVLFPDVNVVLSDT